MASQLVERPEKWLNLSWMSFNRIFRPLKPIGQDLIMTNNKPLASLSLDLDNLWSYMKTHGDPGWESFPSYLDLVVPRILDFLGKRGQKITFFVVGQDAALPTNYSAIRSI